MLAVPGSAARTLPCRRAAGTPAADESLLEEVLDASTSYQAGLGGVTQDSIAADVAEVADALMSQPQPGAGPGAGPGAASAAPAEAKSYAERIHDGTGGLPPCPCARAARVAVTDVGPECRL